MTPVNFPEAQHYLGRPSDMSDDECSALPIARGVAAIGDAGGHFPVVISAWKPTPDELEVLNRGGSIYLHVIGQSMAPVILSTQIEAHTLAGSN